MYQESSAPSFAQQLMKSGLPVSPTYGIKGFQNKTSFFVNLKSTYFEFIRIINSC